MTRSRLYVLVDSVESDMRNFLVRYVLDHMDEESALGPNYGKADLRREADGLSESVSAVQYLDMREAYDVLNRHREVLPTDLGRELRENTPSMDSLVPIRNRVMHGRPLQAGDPETAVSVCRNFQTRYWNTLKGIVDHLDADPTWEPAFENQSRRSDRILHNLPLSEYDETGLIGRAEDCKKIVSHLVKRRESMLTITGEGGIGKTATALEVAYSLVDDVESPYECILWVSLKTERLTASGVVGIVNSIRDLTGAARKLGQAFDTDFRGGVNELAEALEGIETLLIIDNLETVDGEEVIALYERLPDSVNYLFTSRVGVGQFERRIPLGPLKEKDASSLFRQFARSRDVSRLVRLAPNTVKEVVKRLRFSPLAIRWYVLSVEAGEQPNLALENQEDLLDFCVRSVYEGMTPNTQGVLLTLFALERDVTFDELAILTDVSIDSLRRSIHELLNGSMVRLDNDPDGSLVSRVSLTEAAKSYLRRVDTPNPVAVNAILEKEQEFRRSAERRRNDEKARKLAPNVVRTRTSNDEPVAHLLRKALSESKDGVFGPSLHLVERARSMSPDFWEVDRVQGFILSAQGNVDAATSAYLAALRKVRASDDSLAEAVVAYFFAGHLARKAHEVQKATDYARIAHGYFNSPETAQTLGSYLTWMLEFSEGQHFLEWALERAEGRIKLITLTALVDSWRRWSEYLLDHEHRALEAADKAQAGFSIGDQEIRGGISDLRLFDAVLESFSHYIRCVTSPGVDGAVRDQQTARMIKRVSTQLFAFEACRGWRHFPGHVVKLRRTSSNPEIQDLCDRILEYARPATDSEAATQESQRDEIAEGVVKAWCETYGFIAHPRFPKDVFFHGSSVENRPEEGLGDLTGQVVRFIPKIEADGRVRSNWVQIIRGDLK
ncbi:NB-ARC domain-containing protein [Streptomyces sp. NBC_00620]|uniref:NB-ARC domain-containing protein n=1 Tax=Streptomyces sp. NBC_00620 TaxID=2903666 RepID=UPI00224EA14A|nr:NB-ARC domain-containing protein [Streptomyces sp. NBC_00620]MCX4973704.1 NB-ARC domain-containing protein [Streptomyces sp. NBC_00620]